MEQVDEVILEVEQKSFHVDKSALAAESSYFQIMFYGGFKESFLRQIHLYGVSKACFRILLDFLKSGNMELNQGNVTDLLETADFLDLRQAKQLCIGYLVQELRVSNCLAMMSYSQQYGCTQLFHSAFQVAVTHLSELMQDSEDEFSQLDKETLKVLLQTDELYVSNEDLVFDAVMKWVMVDSIREKDFEELVGLVRPAFLSLTFLDVLVKRSQRSKEHDVYTRLLQILNTKPPKTWSIMNEMMSTSRTYETIYVLGGKHEKEQQELYVYMPKTATWRPCSPLQRKNLTQYAVATVGNLMIVTGGYFRGDFVWYSIDWVLIYDSSNNCWTDGPPLTLSRNCHCAVGVGLYLYVIGGSTDEGVTGDVEKLDLAEMTWEAQSPLLRPVERAAAACVEAKLYVICGRDENGDVYSGVQRLDTETGVWDIITYSPMPRYDLCATVLNGVLYTIGGKAMRFDFRTEKWSAIEEECLDRKFYMGCCSANGRMYFLGQRRASITSDIPNFVLFDPYLDFCQVVDTSLPCPLPIRGCVMMRRYDVWP
ncbi:PREDICTED: kelch-like protein 23 [Nanorana parkeri]|uniref:kelch-like protein 23 n=1 Tax=Nanorana parkeri TaxID=125878 RepID=UPI0008542171|nr:PREDICTED: kelch-like protein 23 [Nanorana parkeri]